VGALGYRLVSLCAQGEAQRSLSPGQRGAARITLDLLNWPVAQLMTFALALAADFDRVLSAWRDWHAQGVRLDAGFLYAAARASVASELAEEDAYAVDGPAQAPDLLELRDAMSLVWRILLLWLGVLALFVLAGWAS
jgi:AmpE protein